MTDKELFARLASGERSEELISILNERVRLELGYLPTMYSSLNHMLAAWLDYRDYSHRDTLAKIAAEWRKERGY
jgi:hypothetical protein